MVNSKSKLIVVKTIQSDLVNINQILRCDIEASNRGMLALSTDGLLSLIVWIKKKVIIKHIEDVSDALWQKNGISELIVGCHSGALYRYNIRQDTGLTKTLQLSAKSLLSLVNSKDSSIKSLKGLRIWSHTQKYILIQPQPDRLVILATNLEDRPNIIGVIKTPNLLSAHIFQSSVIVQPCIGMDLYVYDINSCKTVEIINLSVKRTNVDCTQWDYLALSDDSSSTQHLAIADSERRLYVSRFDGRVSQGKKNGVKTSALIPWQVIYPTGFQPSSLYQIILSVSENRLSVFCSTFIQENEKFYYLTCDFLMGGCLILQHKFTGLVSLLPGLCLGLPDLFLTQEGICMLSDQRHGRPELAFSDFPSLLDSLDQALGQRNMEMMSKIKADVEEDLLVFLSSCNYLDGWMEMVETKCQHLSKLLDVLLSNLSSRAVSSAESADQTSLVAMKELIKHLVMTLKDDMTNVMKYVDSESTSQQLLKMVEQMNFYFKSVESITLPKTENDELLITKSQGWDSQSLRDILNESLTSSYVGIAETFLYMKPWVYGAVNKPLIVSMCIDIARQKPEENLLLNMEESYTETLKSKLLDSTDLNEIKLLSEVLELRDVLSSKELLGILLINSIYLRTPHLAFKIPKFWTEFIEYEDGSNVDLSHPGQSNVDNGLNLYVIISWSIDSINLVLCDIYARIGDEDLLNYLDSSSLWKYLLFRKEEYQLLRWIGYQFIGLEGMDEWLSTHPPSNPPSTVLPPTPPPSTTKTPLTAAENKRLNRSTKNRDSLLTGQMYTSDTESLYSLDSSILEVSDIAYRNLSLSSGESYYKIKDFPLQCFGYIDQDMVDSLVTVPTTYLLIDRILNIFAHYGIFSTVEINQPIYMIKRILVNRQKLSEEFKPLFNNEYSKLQISKSTVHQSILMLYHEKDLPSPFYEYLNSVDFDIEDANGLDGPWIGLVSHIFKMQSNQNPQVVYDLCVENVRYTLKSKETLSQDDFLGIFLTMLCAPNATLIDFLKKSTDDETDSSSQSLHDINPLSNLPYFLPNDDGSPDEGVDHPLPGFHYSKVHSTSNLDSNASRRSTDLSQKEVDSLCQVLTSYNLTPLGVIKELSSHELPFLQSLVKDHASTSKDKVDVTVYDLLRDTIPFDISRLFTWQIENKYGFSKDTVQPSFVDVNLSDKDGVVCSLDYYYYLKKGRPASALGSLLLSLPSTEVIQHLKLKESSVMGLALYSWPDKRICSACIAFLHLAHLESHVLRVVLSAADTVLDALASQDMQTEIQENLRKSQLKFLTQELKRILVGLTLVSSRRESSSKLMALFEESIISRISKTPLTEFIKELHTSVESGDDQQSYHVDFESKEVIFDLFMGIRTSRQLSLLYSIEPCPKILEFVACNNQWLLFLVLTQVFDYALEFLFQIVSYFTSESVKEHLNLCLKLYRTQTENVSTFSDLKDIFAMGSSQSQSKGTSDFGNKDTNSKAKIRKRKKKSSEYRDVKTCSFNRRSESNREDSKLEEKSSIDNSRSNPLSTHVNVSENHLIKAEGSSLNIKRQAETGTPIDNGRRELFTKAKWTNIDNNNVFLVIWKCHKANDTARELLEASILLKSPILAVISTCYQPSRKTSCRNAFLYTYTIHELKLDEDKYFGNICPPASLKELYNPEFTDKLISFHLYYQHIDILQEAFQIFYEDSPILPLLASLELTKQGKDIDEITTVFNEYFSNCDQELFGGTIDNEDITNLFVKVLSFGMDLYLKNGYLQKKFMDVFMLFSHHIQIFSVNPVYRLQDNQVPYHILSWDFLSEISGILSVMSIPSSIFCVRDILDLQKFHSALKNLMDYLSDMGKFEQAVKICQHLGLGTSHIFGLQLLSDFSHLLKSNEIKFDDVKSFLLDSHLKLIQKNVSPRDISLFFESLSNEASTPLYKCLALQYSVIWAHSVSFRDFDPKNELNEDKSILTELKENDKLDYNNVVKIKPYGKNKKEKEEKIKYTEDKCLLRDGPNILSSDSLRTETSEPNKVKMGPFTSFEEWNRHREIIELGMWYSHIIHRLEYDSHDELILVPSGAYTKWPWEIDGISTFLTTDDIDKASQISIHLESDNDMWNRLKYEYALQVTKNCTDYESNIDELKALVSEFIRALIEMGLIVTACRVENLFGVYDEDLLMIKNMFKVACDPMCVIDSPQSTRSSNNISHIHDTSNLDPKVEPGKITYLANYTNDKQDFTNTSTWLNRLLAISANLSVGHKISMKVLKLCRVAQELSTTYLDIIQYKDPIHVLMEVLSADRSNSVHLANDLIETLPIEFDVVNSFLVFELFSFISTNNRENETNGSLFNWENLDIKWRQLITISVSSSDIGFQLMDKYYTLSKDNHPDAVGQALIVSVELLIRVHDCFSHSADIEGINSVVQASNLLTKNLVKHQQWSLMGRLLTGVKRYNEMCYMIDILKQHGQLERLLTSYLSADSIPNSGGLDRTLVYFLQSKYPEEIDLLRKVSLHFKMYSELAKLWVDEAESNIRNVLGASLFVKSPDVSSNDSPSGSKFFARKLSHPEKYGSNTSSIVVDYLKSPDVALLIRAIHCYCQAAQFYIKENQLTMAMYYSHQGELIAAQLMLMKTAKDNLTLSLIKLTPRQLDIVSSRYLCVREIIIVLRAYGRTPDWSSSLYHNYVREGYASFLDEFLKFSRLSQSVVLDIVKKIERNGMEPAQKERMSKLLQHVGNADVVYKIASQLGIKNIIEDCLESSATCYLKDTVFNKGIAGSYA